MCYGDITMTTNRLPALMNIHPVETRCVMCNVYLTHFMHIFTTRLQINVVA